MLPVEPIGLGTADAESFSHFVIRAADENTTPLYELFWDPGKHRGERPLVTLPLIARNRNIGSSPTGYRIAQIIARSMQIPAVRHFSCYRPDSGMSTADLLAPTPRWCPHCFASNGAYPRAVWEIQLNTACAKHGTRLVSACACGRSFAFFFRHYFNRHCPSCRASLAEAPTTPADPDEIEFAREMERFVAAWTGNRIRWNAVRFLAALQEIAAANGARTLSQLARYYGLPVPAVHHALRQTRDLAVMRIFSACYYAGIPPVSFLRGEPVAPGTIPSRALPWRQLKQIDDEALHRRITEHPIFTSQAAYHGLHHLAGELRVSPDRLEMFCPELLAALGTVRAARELQEKEERMKALTRDAEAAVQKTEEASRQTGKRFGWGLFCRHLIRGGRCMNKENLALVQSIFLAAQRRLVP